MEKSAVRQTHLSQRRNTLKKSMVNDYLNNKLSEDSKFSYPEVSNAIEALLNHDDRYPWVNEFEKKFASRMGINYAIACNSGTSGLHAALFAVGISEGDEVIIPALTVIMDAYAVLHHGGVPVFADVDEATHLITVDEIEKKITPRTKAIVTVAWDGVSCDMDPIMALAKKHNLLVVDDCARTLLSTYKGKLVGTLADISVFSFESKKHLSAGGEGGMVVSNNEKLAIRVRKFAGIGYKHMTADAGRTHLAIDTVQDPRYKRFDTIGVNYRMNDITAAVGLGQLERIDEIVNRRQEVGKIFLDLTSGFDWFIPQETPPHCTHSYYTFSVDYRGVEELGVSWKQFYDRYKSLGGDGFYGIVGIPYTEPALAGKIFGKTECKLGLCPISEGLQERVMCFKTNYRDLTDASQKVKILAKLLRSF
jgi:perosamine synthetase